MPWLLSDDDSDTVCFKRLLHKATAIAACCFTNTVLFSYCHSRPRCESCRVTLQEKIELTSLHQMSLAPSAHPGPCSLMFGVCSLMTGMSQSRYREMCQRLPSNITTGHYSECLTECFKEIIHAIIPALNKSACHVKWLMRKTAIILRSQETL